MFDSEIAILAAFGHATEGSVKGRDTAYARCQRQGCGAELVIGNNPQGQLRVITSPVATCSKLQ